VSDESVLSKDEIDALLSTAENESDQDDDLADSGARSVDFSKQTMAGLGRMPFVEVVNEKFAREFRSQLQLAMRMSFDVRVGGTRVVDFREYTQQLRTPTAMTLFECLPFAGQGVIALDASLVDSLVEQYFGGFGGEQSASEGRAFTSTERRLITKIVGSFTQELTAAWGELIDVRFLPGAQEFNPSLINDIVPTELLVVSPFSLEFDGGGGEFSYAIPLHGVEPHRSKLDRAAGVQQMPPDPDWKKKLDRALRHAPLSITCCVAETDMRLENLLAMQPGDVIPVSMPDQHLVKIEGHGMFYARLGDSNGNLALEYLTEADGD